MFVYLLCFYCRISPGELFVGGFCLCLDDADSRLTLGCRTLYKNKRPLDSSHT